MPSAELTEVTTPRPPVQHSGRVVSVDALRGFDMFWILGGDFVIRSLQKLWDTPLTRTLAEQMEHCEWAGFRFYDLIFPLFVFLAGVSIAFSLPKLVEAEGKPAAFRRILIRSLLLVFLGIIYMGGVSNGFANISLPGVLQRIGVAYFFASSVFLVGSTRTLAITSIALLIGYWALLTFVAVPGLGEPSYEQGKNLAYWIDQNFLPGKKFEGTILSTLPAVANCLFGVFAGLLLKSSGLSEQTKVSRLVIAGIVSLSIGYLWSVQFPIIKLLWTSTYVLVACGWGALLLAAFHQLIEVRQWQRWAQPFIWIGMNAITIYLLSALLNFYKLADRFVGGDVAKWLGNGAGVVKGVVVLAMVLAVVRFLYQRKIFLRL